MIIQNESALNYIVTIREIWHVGKKVGCTFFFKTIVEMTIL